MVNVVIHYCLELDNAKDVSIKCERSLNHYFDNNLCKL